MTNAESGMSGSLWLCATVDGTYKELGEMLDLKMKVDGKDIDTSNNGDGAGALPSRAQRAVSCLAAITSS